MYKYIALDFDGTLLGNDHNISKRSVSVLKKLQDKGITVLLCSGRNVSQMNFVAKKIDSDNHDTFIISDNGGVVTEIDYGKRKVLRDAKFESDDFKQIINQVAGKTKILIAFNNGQRYLKKRNIREMIRAYVLFKERTIIGMPEQASKILLVDDKMKIEDIYDDVKTEVLDKFPYLNVFRSVPRLIEITPNGSTKGQGLETVFQNKGWDLSELIAFGDGENDISMFQVAGKAVAMANAFDTVKAEADEVCLSNTEDGVAKYLEELYKEIL